MIVILVAIMRAHISPPCEIFVDTGRAALVIAGMRSGNSAQIEAEALGSGYLAGT
jgi:hypothetical protein